MHNVQNIFHFFCGFFPLQERIGILDERGPCISMEHVRFDQATPDRNSKLGPGLAKKSDGPAKPSAVKNLILLKKKTRLLRRNAAYDRRRVQGLQEFFICHPFTQNTG